MWDTVHQSLQQAPFWQLADEQAHDSIERFFVALQTEAPALASRLVTLAATPVGQSRWQAIAASAFIRRALLSESAFAEHLLNTGFRLTSSGESLVQLIEAHGASMGLRRYRCQHMLQIAWLDLAGELSLADSLEALSTLADTCLQRALAIAADEVGRKHGALVNEDGRTCHLYAICMGKLGGRELNFSSDIDLVFTYSGHGQSDGPKSLDASEYCLRQARKVIELLDAPTEYGRVFRVDTRLRPFGESGPLAVSLAALESYLQQHGRDWERYAFVKARFVGASSVDEASLDPEINVFRRNVIRPFVYRQYLDFGVLSSLRDMKRMISKEVERRDMRDHLKLGPGGIREVEFIVQSWQLIRGGRVSALRTASLYEALAAAVESDCLPAQAAAALRQAYCFLRQIENRLQALDDRQTHTLPRLPQERQALVLAMQGSSWASLMQTLDGHRAAVAEHFNDLAFGDTDNNEAPDIESASPLGWLTLPEDTLQAMMVERGWSDPMALSAELAAFRHKLGSLPMDNIARARLKVFVARALAVIGPRRDAVTALTRVLSVALSVLRRSAYLSLLNEQPAALERLVELAAASVYLTEQLVAYPMLIDELLDARLSGAPLSRDALGAELEALFAEHAPEDAETAMQTLVRFARAAWFRVAVADCIGLLPIMRVSDHLSQIAEIILQATTEIAWQDLSAQVGVPAGCDAHQSGFAIVAYGKLGGVELGYGSDLDLVFLHGMPEGETSGPKCIDNQLFVARLARRIVHFLGVQTGHGQLYEVDTRLRPSGRSGLLVSSLAAFERYQRSDAWTWEHQALIRARPVAGDPVICEIFTRIRGTTLMRDVNRTTLADEVLKMRQRMRDSLSRASPGEVDLKQDSGGIADLEFLVQYLVLKHAARAPGLLEWSDNIRQLDSLVSAGVLDASTATALQDAYRALRQQVHRLSLDNKPPLIDTNRLLAERELITAVWQRVFGIGESNSRGNA